MKVGDLVILAYDNFSTNGESGCYSKAGEFAVISSLHETKPGVCRIATRYSQNEPIAMASLRVVEFDEWYRRAKAGLAYEENVGRRRLQRRDCVYVFNLCADFLLWRIAAGHKDSKAIARAMMELRGVA